MTTLLLTFLLFAVVVGLLALVVKLSGRPLKQPCDGTGGGSCACKNQGLAEGSCGEEHGQGRSEPRSRPPR